MKYTGWNDAALQKKILGLADTAAHAGVTVAELRDYFGTDAHHGYISGALSMLHQNNHLARLAEKRGACKIYVHPDFLDGRKAEAQGRGDRLSKEEIAWFQSLESTLDYWSQVDTAGARFTTDLTKAERNKGLFVKEMLAMVASKPGDRT